MPLNIKDSDTHALAKRLASLTGESLTQAVKRAIQERLAHGSKKPRVSIRLADELDHIALHCAALPRRDRRSAEEIIGYDERGLPGLMVIDTSALIAIMNNEPQRRRFNELIEAATATYVSAASLLEARMVLFARSGDNAVLALMPSFSRAA